MNIQRTEPQMKQNEYQCEMNAHCTIHSTDSKMYTYNLLNRQFPLREFNEVVGLIGKSY
jgi:hypothetical protein